MATITITLNTGLGTQQWTPPADCIIIDKIELWGPGGSGGNRSAGRVTGGGAGAYNAIIGPIAVASLLVGGTVPYLLGQGGTAQSVAGSSGNPGSAKTWFSAIGTYAADFGLGGIAAGGGTVTGGAGGLVANCVPTSDAKVGGNGGNNSATTGASGGGASGSAAGVGVNGIAVSTGIGGAGGTAPAGGGNGGAGALSGTAVNGSLPGGGGGAINNAAGTSGAGGNGQIVITYTQAIVGNAVGVAATGLAGSLLTESANPQNVASSANGGVAVASSFDPRFPPSFANDGIRGAVLNPGWFADATVNATLDITFSGFYSISEIDVFTDTSGYWANPTLADTFTTQSGISDFLVQYWNGVSYQTLATVVGNNHVWRQFFFSPVITNKIRIVVTRNHNDYAYTQISELEAWGFPVVTAIGTGVSGSGFAAAMGGGTFARASAATYLDASGQLMGLVGNDVLRPNYVSGVFCGALLELASTNLISNSKSQRPVGNAARFSFTTVTEIPALLPGSGVWKIVDIGGTSDNNAGSVTWNTLTTGAQYVCSLWVWIPSSYTSSMPVLQIDVGAGQIAVATASSVKRDQWQRIITSGFVAASPGSYMPMVLRAVSVLGDFFYHTCWQFEAGGTATSHIQTTGVAATRADDLISSAGIPWIMSSITGVSATGAVGTVGILKPLIGASGTGTVGTANAWVYTSATFTRASNATYIDFDGVLRTAANNVLRTNYRTGSPVLLIEPAATNLVAFSQSLQSWSTNPAPNDCNRIANQAYGLDGSFTATNLVPSMTSGSHVVYRVFTGANSTPYTMSAYVKANGHNYVKFGLENSAFPLQDFVIDLTDGSVFRNFGGGVVSVTSAGNGWWYITQTVTSLSSGSNFVAAIQPEKIAGDQTFIGDGVSGVLAWGAQVELGTVATSYIVTGAGTATRAADRFSVPFAVTGTGSVKAMSLNNTRSLVGVAGISQTGNVSIGNVTSLADGVVGAGQAATISPGDSTEIIGIAATGSVGIPFYQITVTRGGIAISGRAGAPIGNDIVSLGSVFCGTQIGNVQARPRTSMVGISTSGLIGTLGKKVAEVATSVAAHGLLGSAKPRQNRTIALFSVIGIGSSGVVSTGGKYITVSLYSDLAGNPDQLIAVLGTILDDSISGLSRVRLPLATPIPLASNTRYWIQLRDNSASTIKWVAAGDPSGPGVATESWHKPASSDANATSAAYQMRIIVEKAALGVGLVGRLVIVEIAIDRDIGATAIGVAGSVTTQAPSNLIGVVSHGLAGKLIARLVIKTITASSIGIAGRVVDRIAINLPSVAASSHVNTGVAKIVVIAGGAAAFGAAGSVTIQAPGKLIGVASDGRAEGLAVRLVVGTIAASSIGIVGEAVDKIAIKLPSVVASSHVNAGITTIDVIADGAAAIGTTGSAGQKIDVVARGTSAFGTAGSVVTEQKIDVIARGAAAIGTASVTKQKIDVVARGAAAIGVAGSVTTQAPGKLIGVVSHGQTGKVTARISLFIAASSVGIVGELVDKIAIKLPSVAAATVVGSVTIQGPGKLIGVASNGRAEGLAVRLVIGLPVTTSMGIVGGLVDKIAIKLPSVAAATVAGRVTIQAPNLNGVAAHGQAGNLAVKIGLFIVASSIGIAGRVVDKIAIKLPSVAASSHVNAGVTKVQVIVGGAAAFGAAGSVTEQVPGKLIGVASHGQTGKLAVRLVVGLPVTTSMGIVGGLVDKIAIRLPSVAASSRVNAGITKVVVIARGAAAFGAAGSVSKRVPSTLIGVASNGQAGSFGATKVDVIARGAAAFGAAGSVTELIVELDVASSGLVGSLAVELDLSLTSSSAIGVAGDLPGKVGVTLAISSSGIAGTIADQIVIVLPSVIGSGSVSLATEIIAIVSGVAAVGAAGSVTVLAKTIPIIVIVPSPDPIIVPPGFLMVAAIDMTVVGMTEIILTQLSPEQDFGLRIWLSTDYDALAIAPEYYPFRRSPGHFPLLPNAMPPVIIYAAGQIPPENTIAIPVKPGQYVLNILNLTNEQYVITFIQTSLTSLWFGVTDGAWCSGVVGDLQTHAVHSSDAYFTNVNSVAAIGTVGNVIGVAETMPVIPIVSSLGPIVVPPSKLMAATIDMTEVTMMEIILTQLSATQDYSLRIWLSMNGMPIAPGYFPLLSSAMLPVIIYAAGQTPPEHTIAIPVTPDRYVLNIQNLTNEENVITFTQMSLTSIKPSDVTSAWCSGAVGDLQTHAVHSSDAYFANLSSVAAIGTVGNVIGVAETVPIIPIVSSSGPVVVPPSKLMMATIDMTEITMMEIILTQLSATQDYALRIWLSMNGLPIAPGHFPLLSSAMLPVIIYAAGQIPPENTIAIPVTPGQYVLNILNLTNEENVMTFTQTSLTSFKPSVTSAWCSGAVGDLQTDLVSSTDFTSVSGADAISVAGSVTVTAVIDSIISIVSSSEPVVVPPSKLMVATIDMTEITMMEIILTQLSATQDYSLRIWLSMYSDGMPIAPGHFPLLRSVMLPVIIYAEGQTPPANTIAIPIAPGQYVLNILNLTNEENVMTFTQTSLA